MMKRTALLFSLFVAAMGVAAPGVTAQSDFPDIKNFFRVNEQFCTGGQPSMENLQKMKEQGVRAVVNLRMASEFNAEEEAAMAKKLDLRYFHIPIDRKNIRDEQAEEFLKITSDSKNHPAFIHCAAANRVGAFWMVRRVLVDKWKVEDAEAEARKIGLTSEELRTWALDYIKRHQKHESK